MIEQILRKLTAEIESLKKRVEQLSAVEKPWSFVPLITPLTSADFDGDSFSTTAKTKIDLSAKFGVPAGVKAIYASVRINDSDSATKNCYLILSPNDNSGSGKYFSTSAIADRKNYTGGIISCDANGDIYYQIFASGVDTFDLQIVIWDYWR